MGGSVQKVIKGTSGALQTAAKQIGSGDFGGFAQSTLDLHGLILDPGGLVYNAKDPNFATIQSGIDVANIGANPYQEGQRAEVEAGKQKALVAKQQKLIDDEKAKLDAARSERATRLKSNVLLSGSETGVKGSLLS